MTFYLGTHKRAWLGQLNVPLMVSRAAFIGAKSYPLARRPWFLDSRGFTEIAMHGRWTIGPEEFVRQVSRISAQVGRLKYAAPQDWMCEPEMVVKTGLSVEEHQRRTVDNFVRLREIAPQLPWIPVLQGWEVEDYRRHRLMYAAAGFDLSVEPLVGLGSVCRRQHVREIGWMVRDFAGDGLRLHGFGFKKAGMAMVGDALASADSLAWSFDARYTPVRLKGCRHRTCANCQKYAMQWRSEVIDMLPHGTEVA